MWSSKLSEILRRSHRLCHGLRFHEAIAELESALHTEDLSSDDTTELLQTLGEQHFGIGDLEAAQAVFADVVERASPGSDRACAAHRQLVQLHRYAGQLAEAEHHALVLQRERSFESDFEEQMAARHVELCRSGEPLLRVVVVAIAPDGSDPERTMTPRLIELDRVGYFVEVDDFLRLPDRTLGWSLEWRRNRPELSDCERLVHAASTWDRRDTRVDDLRWAGALDPLSPRPPAELGHCLRWTDEERAIESLRRAHELAPGWPGTGGLAMRQRSPSPRPAFVAPWAHGAEPYPHSAEQRADARRLLNEAFEAAETDFERARILGWLADMSDDIREKQRCLELALGLDGDLMTIAHAKVMLLELSEARPR